MALGELIYEHTGRVIGQRVLSVKEEEQPKIKSSFSARGKFKGSDVTETTTNWSIPRPGGVFYGEEAQGVIITSNGDEMATYLAYEVGRFSGPGGRISFRGSVYYRTSSTEGKLASINNLVRVFEYEVDESGSTRAKVWEWK
jgi:hypothetical protein